MTAYDSLVEHLKETQLVGSINSLLGWDERTKLPKGGGAYRAEQMTYVSGLLHKMRTDPRVGDWLAEAEQQVGEQDPHSCLLYTSPSPRDRTRSRMPSSA